MNTESLDVPTKEEVPTSSARFLEKFTAMQEQRRSGAVHGASLAIDHARRTIANLTQWQEPKGHEEQERWTREFAQEFSRLGAIASGVSEKTQACAWTNDEFALLQARSREILQELHDGGRLGITPMEWRLFFRPLILPSYRVSDDTDTPRLLDPFWTIPSAFDAAWKGAERKILAVHAVALPAVEHECTFSRLHAAPQHGELWTVMHGKEALFATSASLLSLAKQGELLTVYGTSDPSLQERMMQDEPFEGKLLIRSIAHESNPIPIMSKTAPQFFVHRSLDPEAMDPYWNLNDEDQHFHLTSPLGEHLPSPSGLSIEHAL